MLRTLWGDDERFKRQYWSELPGYYFAGDGARFDKDGYLWVVGRIDDVLNVSGHRIGTAEVESAIVSHPSVAEAAVVGRPDDLKGQALVCFVTLQERGRGLTASSRRTSAPMSPRRSARLRVPMTCASPRACRRPAAARSCAASSRR